MSGPSATAKPMSAKMTVSSSVTWLIGCTRPISAGASRTGSVTSTVSALRRVSSAAASSAFLRAAMAALTRSLRPLIAGPCTLRSSGVILPSVLSSADTEPLLPSAATRTCSRAAPSFAEATAESRSVSSCEMSGIDADLSSGWQRGLGLLHDRLECHRLADREIRQHLAVNGEPGLGQASDELRVVQAEGSHRGIQALNP